MTMVVFYEKPGCLGNVKQKQMLARLGHRLHVHDLLSEPWTAERLRPFFGALPVAAWFNPTAPRVKSGEVDPAALDEAGALSAMLADPILIRRPLLDTTHGCCAGFEPGPVLDALGVQFAPGEDLQSCVREQTAGTPATPSCDDLAATADSSA
jgi:nitrogenase-associated protein